MVQEPGDADATFSEEEVSRLKRFKERADERGLGKRVGTYRLREMLDGGDAWALPRFDDASRDVGFNSGPRATIASCAYCGAFGVALCVKCAALASDAGRPKISNMITGRCDYCRCSSMSGLCGDCQGKFLV